MNKILLFLLCFSSLSFAQKRAVKINALSTLFIPGFEFSYEEVTDDNNSVEFTLGYSKFDVNNDVNPNNFKSVGAELKYKFFTKKDNTTFEGFYVAPLIQYVSANRKKLNGGPNESINQIGLGSILGNQWIIGNKTKKSGFVIDLNGGFQFNHVSAPVYLDTSKSKGLNIRIGLSLGYSF